MSSKTYTVQLDSEDSHCPKKLTTQQVESGKFSYFAAVCLTSWSDIGTASLSLVLPQQRNKSKKRQDPARWKGCNNLRAYGLKKKDKSPWRTPNKSVAVESLEYVECQEHPEWVSPYHPVPWYIVQYHVAGTRIWAVSACTIKEGNLKPHWCCPRKK